MTFDYRYTCPEINMSIDSLKGEIRAEISEALDDNESPLEGEERQSYIKNFADRIYSYIEDTYEAIRKTNADIRDEAEKQIEKMEQRLDTANETIKELEGDIRILESNLEQYNQ